MTHDLDALVRRVDEDRWLASRFAPRDVSAALVALYALNYEIARTAEAVTQPGLGAIRLAWWRDRVAEMHAGDQPKNQPALEAYAAVAARYHLAHAPLEALIEARATDLEAAPYADWTAIETYLDATGGNLVRLALSICGVEDHRIAPSLALAWGLAGLVRARAAWAARGRSALPRSGGSFAEMARRARGAYDAARALSPSLPPAAFPAIGYVTLTQFHMRRVEQGLPAPLFSRQWRLVRAAALGRV